ncbi:DMT family transporter [Pacificoceanicola onchidii]|uniref:DMT family transporter n=1 Tax=Pacificoceanicola onchidii TaxID=2562685 RepID=UPI0010A3E4ED|nr:DMT family transporter [Pacificoceanicola onchidii]
MKLFGLVAVVMVAFAANSVLTRAGVSGGTDIVSFGALRLWSGALMLGLLCLWTRRRVAIMSKARVFAVPGLLFYIIGFTEAYVGMDSGLGALLLFGTVQVTMFAGAAVLRETMPALRLVGGLLALAGLVYLVWPWADIADNLRNVAMMVLAGIGWGLYSLAGRGSRDALADTAVNFVLAGLLFPGFVWLVSGGAPLGGLQADPMGVVLALVSGAVTSGLGYALWYSVLPKLPAALAAVAQLTVPPIAMAGGMLFLEEALTGKFLLASVVILGGIALSVLGPAYLTKASKGS